LKGDEEWILLIHGSGFIKMMIVPMLFVQNALLLWRMRAFSL